MARQTDRQKIGLKWSTDEFREIDRQTREEQTDGQTEGQINIQRKRQGKICTCVLILLPVLLYSSVQSFDKVVDVLATSNWIPDELQSICN
jgi:hypothetical protein